MHNHNDNALRNVLYPLLKNNYNTIYDFAKKKLKLKTIAISEKFRKPAHEFSVEIKLIVFLNLNSRVSIVGFLSFLLLIPPLT